MDALHGLLTKCDAAGTAALRALLESPPPALELGPNAEAEAQMQILSDAVAGLAAAIAAAQSELSARPLSDEVLLRLESCVDDAAVKMHVSSAVSYGLGRGEVRALLNDWLLSTARREGKLVSD